MLTIITTTQNALNRMILCVSWSGSSTLIAVGTKVIIIAPKTLVPPPFKVTLETRITTHTFMTGHFFTNNLLLQLNNLKLIYQTFEFSSPTSPPPPVSFYTSQIKLKKTKTHVHTYTCSQITILRGWWWLLYFGGS